MPDIRIAMISSTARDLPAHRKEVMDACQQQGLFPKMMEQLPASDDDAIAASLRMVAESQIYIGIFANRYGHVPAGHDISITEMEYQRACDLGIPRLVFLMDADHDIRARDVETGPGAEKLRVFKKRVETENVVNSFKSPADLRAQVLHSLIPYRPSTSAAAADPLLGDRRAAYLQALAEAFRWIDLGGLAPQVGGELLRLPLDDVFIHVHAERDIPLAEECAREEARLLRELEERGATPEEIDRELDRAAAKVEKATKGEGKASTQRVEADEILKQTRTVVLGDPGAGKTTLLRFLARAAALRNPQVTTFSDVEPFPVYLRLGEYAHYVAQNGPMSLHDYVPAAARARGLDLPAELLAAEVRGGRALFLLDGLDEIIQTGQRIEIRNRVEELARSHPRCRLIVTSRIVGYRDAQLPRGESGFAHVTLSPFDDDEIARFAALWYGAIRAKGDLTDPERQNAGALVEGIRSLPGVRRLAANPLLLTLIALIYWREVRLPRRRVELYASATRMLLNTWVRRNRPGIGPISEREATSLLMAVAFQMHKTSNAGLISRPDLERVLVGLKTDPRRGGLAELEAQRQVDVFLGIQGEHCGLLYPRGYDDRNREVFGFLHLTFEEYLSGRELARRWKEGQLKLSDYLHRPRWEEPLLLACAHLSDDDDNRLVNDFVREVLDAGSPFESLLHRDLLLAARCLADDAMLSRELIDRVFEGVDAAFSTSIIPLNDQIATTLASMRGGHVESEATRLLLLKVKDAGRDVLQATVSALGRLGAAAGPDTVEAALVERLKVRDQYELEAVTEALEAVGPTGSEPWVLDRLAELLTQPESRGRRIEDIVYRVLYRLATFITSPPRH